MDYRSSIQDDEHPTGASPWGSPPATPQRNITSYNSIPGAGNGFAQDDPGIDAFKRPNTASSTASTTEYQASEPSEPSQQASVNPESEAQPNAPQQQLATQGEASNNGLMSAPGTQQGQQPRRPPGPQYKLQAKITGLERTGKKDPILRFDVHVRTTSQPLRSHLVLSNAIWGFRRTYPNSEPPSSAMSVAYIPSLANLPPTSYRLIPMPWFPQYPLH